LSLSSEAHYDRVTRTWKKLMGDHFHFGYFESEDMGLPAAAERMIDRMAGMCTITEDTRILDVGCGIGAPAFYLHEKYGCSIDGISTSERGIELANQATREKGYQKVRFKVADGMDNGYPDNTFDIVWIMEAAHLIPDKKRLMRECYRVLKDRGTLVMCDIMVYIILPPHKAILFALKHVMDYYHMAKAWGPGQPPTMGNYTDRMVEAGFRNVNVVDITDKVLPTLKWWRENALVFLNQKKGTFPEEDVRQFVTGCERLAEFFRMGIFGYGMIKAEKHRPWD